MDSLARKVKPYNISMGDSGSMKLPSLNISAMTEPITDLHTFLICLNPRSGICQLQKHGDTYTNPKPLRGNFASGNIIVGEDYIVSAYTLEKITRKYLWLKVVFHSPESSHLAYVDPDMKISVDSSGYNNFQMVTEIAKDHYNVLWGKEDFTLWMKVSRKTGIILSGNMINHLHLKMKVNAGKNYQHASAEIPLTIFRQVKLERIK